LSSDLCTSDHTKLDSSGLSTINIGLFSDELSLRLKKKMSFKNSKRKNYLKLMLSLVESILELNSGVLFVVLSSLSGETFILHDLSIDSSNIIFFQEVVRIRFKLSSMFILEKEMINLNFSNKK